MRPVLISSVVLVRASVVLLFKIRILIPVIGILVLIPVVWILIPVSVVRTTVLVVPSAGPKLVLFSFLISFGSLLILFLVVSESFIFNFATNLRWLLIVASFTDLLYDAFLLAFANKSLDRFVNVLILVHSDRNVCFLSTVSDSSHVYPTPSSPFQLSPASVLTCLVWMVVKPATTSTFSPSKSQISPTFNSSLTLERGWPAASALPTIK